MSVTFITAVMYSKYLSIQPSHCRFESTYRLANNMACYYLQLCLKQSHLLEKNSLSKWKQKITFIYLSMLLHPPKFLVCCRPFSDSSAKENTKFACRKDFRFYVWAVFCKVIVLVTILSVRHVFHHSTLILFPVMFALERVVWYCTGLLLASAAKQMRTALFWVITQRVVVIPRLQWSRGSVLAFSTQVRGFKPGRSRRIFRAKKSSARLPSEGK